MCFQTTKVGVDLDLEDENDSKCVFVSDGIWKEVAIDSLVEWCVCVFVFVLVF